MAAGRPAPPPNLQYAGPQQPYRSRTLLLPAPGVPPVVNTRPNPNRLALHQAHLRDPVNRLISIDAAGEKETQLFPCLTSFVVDPTPLGQTAYVFKWQFSLSQTELNRRPGLQSQGRGQRMLRTLMEGNQSYRLRCIKVPPSATQVSEHAWCVADTAWPFAIYIFVNGVEFYPRRKIHNGRDLPLDITHELREGVNQVSINVVRSPAEQKDLTYAMALEVLTFHSFSHVKAVARSLPAAESRKQICGRLARNQPGEDDELRIVSDDLKITLVDPFTARLFVVPVRGSHCEHPECFDHETFLQTRALTSGNRSPIEADWRCPICRQDARPQSLVVDGFLAEVRAELARTNHCTGARTLQIKADGSWEVKADADDPASQPGSPQPCCPALKRKSSALEDGARPSPHRLKIDRPASTSERILNESSAVIILD
jgi:hypothetical protein